MSYTIEYRATGTGKTVVYHFSFRGLVT